MACDVERGGLGVVDGGRRDASPVDARIDAPVRDLGTSDLGRVDLGVSDLGRVDLGVTACRPLDCPGRRCDPVGNVCSHHPSCLALRDDDRVAPLASDIYEIDLDGAGASAPVRVYCDMSTASGGWTLIARTTGISAVPAFGWTAATGAVDLDAEPYSLGVGSALLFTEVLVGKRGTGKRWGDRLYRFTVPVGFVATYATSAYTTTDVTPVGASCSPPAGGPAMLAHVGYTSTSDHFFFRDTAPYDVFGMRPDGFDLYYAGCNEGGELQSTEGMIMVR